MVALIFGVIFLGFAVFSILPAPLAWLPFVVTFIKGSLPVLALIFGLLCVFIGIADIKDRVQNKKEEALEKESKKNSN